ncbi:MAG TPA: heavy metal-responsive transcriptional regulator [Candidatus Binatus sp.]|nr:heavy metal-responsive transcriptional regulator [Candidatus Binatus sp.]
MRIGELARQSGLAPSALRYYEQVGLLPAPRRTSSGYRSYGDDALDRLAFVRSAQAVGLTLAEVRQVLGIRDAGDAPCRVVTELIDRRHAEVRAGIAELQSLERELTQLRERADRLEPRDCDPSGICHIIPKLSPTSSGAMRTSRRSSRMAQTTE